MGLELGLRNLLKEVYNKLDEVKTLVATTMITPDGNAGDLLYVGC